MILGQLAARATTDDLLTDYPHLERADVHAALEYAAAIVNQHEVPIARSARGSCSTRTSPPRSSNR